VAAGLALLAFLPAAPAAAKEPAPRSRSFEFTYAFTVTGLEPGQLARVWVPLAPSTDAQEARVRSTRYPGKVEVGTEPQYGNKILYVRARAGARGKIEWSMTYEVTRREVKGRAGKGVKEPKALLERFLAPDALVPVSGKPLELLKDKELPRDATAKAKLFYEVVNDHMRYSKEGKGWGRGDAVWACDSRTGNCSDFHSLFISLARSQKIPAKFEIGFPLPEKRGAGAVGGYHCWAFFRPDDKGWVPVDISEANKNPRLRGYYFGNLSEDRVTFSTGRDLDLVPRQQGKPLNFFVYPYVEVGGKEYPQEKIDKTFTYRERK
jgi:transglutaminase-like putative cysteine protease